MLKTSLLHLFLNYTYNGETISPLKKQYFKKKIKKGVARESVEMSN